jgi:hypothetical protein
VLFAQAALLPVEERVRGTARIPSREQCEMILMVGLPSAGQQSIRSGSFNLGSVVEPEPELEP